MKLERLSGEHRTKEQSERGGLLLHGGDVPNVGAGFLGLEEPAEDLARARLGQCRYEFQGRGGGDRPQFPAGTCSIRAAASASEGDVADDDDAGSGVLDAGGSRGVAEAGVYHRVNGPQAAQASMATTASTVRGM